MVSVQEAKEKIVSFLENNLSDPLSRNKKWIYDDIPRTDLSQYPRIGVEAVNNQLEWYRIGGTEEVNEALIHVYVFVKKKQKIEINNELKRDVQIADYLSSQIIKLIKDNQDTFYNDGFLMIKPIGEDTHPTDNLIIKDITLKTIFVR